MSQKGWLGVSMGQHHTLGVDENNKVFALGRYSQIQYFSLPAVCEKIKRVRIVLFNSQKVFLLPSVPNPEPTKSRTLIYFLSTSVVDPKLFFSDPDPH
jgi:hypothetical protein